MLFKLSHDMLCFVMLRYAVLQMIGQFPSSSENHHMVLISNSPHTLLVLFCLFNRAHSTHAVNDLIEATVLRSHKKFTIETRSMQYDLRNVMCSNCHVHPEKYNLIFIFPRVCHLLFFFIVSLSRITRFKCCNQCCPRC